MYARVKSRAPHKFLVCGDISARREKPDETPYEAPPPLLANIFAILHDMCILSFKHIYYALIT